MNEYKNQKVKPLNNKIVTMKKTKVHTGILYKISHSYKNYKSKKRTKKRNKTKELHLEKSLVTMNEPLSLISEQYRTIRTNIQFTTVNEKQVHSLMVTSSDQTEGKSTTSANLAVVFAQQGKTVLLVDADLRRPSLHLFFKKSNSFGLTNILTQKLQLNEAIKNTYVSNLFLLTSGPVPPNPIELLSSRAMEKIVEQINEEFDIIIYDTPPILTVSDAQVISNYCDSSLLVVASGKTENNKAVKAKEQLQSGKAKFIGVVLNNKEVKKHHDDYYYYQSSDK